jgi:hypothetical protein
MVCGTAQYKNNLRNLLAPYATLLCLALKTMLLSGLAGPARAHLLGRDVSAAQSNGELTARLIRQWIMHGDLPDHDGLEQRVNEISEQEIIQLLPAFTRGSIVAIRNPQENQ